MKTLHNLRFLMALATSLMFINCTSEYTVIHGEDGIDGIDGGDAAQVCIDCHSNTHREPIYASYEFSFHSKGITEGAVEYAGARASCARCHSHEGYTDFMDYGSVNPTGYYGLSEPELVINDNGTPDDTSDDYPELDEYGIPIYSNNPVPVVTEISCTTCHDTHISFDFENDGNDYALRGLHPVELITDGTVIDYGARSNVCINCHQPRSTGPTPDASGNFRITSTHWGPHHGPQSTLLEGIQGALIAGTVPYPNSGTAAHRTGSSCVNCHMSETTDGTDGLHSLKPTENACVSCHNNGIPSEDFLQSDMNTLAALLEITGAVHDDHPVPGLYTLEVAQAAWNYLFVLEDASKGIHNPGYAKALIKNSIEALQD
jgi:hypothetical protein